VIDRSKPVVRSSDIVSLDFTGQFGVIEGSSPSSFKGSRASVISVTFPS